MDPSHLTQKSTEALHDAQTRALRCREVETRIGRALVAGDARDGAVIRVGLADGGLAMTYENPA